MIKDRDLPNAKRMKVKYKQISGTSLFYLHNEWQRTKISFILQSLERFVTPGTTHFTLATKSKLSDTKAGTLTTFQQNGLKTIKNKYKVTNDHQKVKKVKNKKKQKKQNEELNQRREIWRLRTHFTSAIHYYHVAFELVLRIHPAGFLEVQIMKYLRIVSKKHRNSFFDSFFETSKANNTSKA